MNIIDVNDEMPLFEQSEYVFRVREHMEPFTEVGTVTAVDRDAPPHNTFIVRFQKSNSETENFVVEPQTGKILTRRQLDREMQVSTHVFRFQVGNSELKWLKKLSKLSKYLTVLFFNWNHL